MVAHAVRLHLAVRLSTAKSITPEGIFVGSAPLIGEREGSLQAGLAGAEHGANIISELARDELRCAYPPATCRRAR